MTKRCLYTSLPLPVLQREILIAACGGERIRMALHLFASAMGLNEYESDYCSANAAVVLESADSARDYVSEGWWELAGSGPFPGRFFFHPDTFQTVIAVVDEKLNFSKMVVAGRLYTSFGMLPFMLPGNHISLLHGALLQVPCEESAVVLFGENGIGKTTTANRFYSNGGIALADDGLILSMDRDGEFRAQPLPTWSRWQSPARERAPAVSTRAVKVKAFLQLTRGNDDRILENDPVQWKIGLLKSLGEHYSAVSHYMTKEIAGKAVLHASGLVEPAFRKFGSFELRASLSGNLLRRIDRYVKTRNSG